MRYKTKTFQLIENYLKTCCDKCFRAHDVYDYIVANEMKVNISTVYRNLEQSVDAGQLIKYKQLRYLLSFHLLRYNRSK